MTCNQLLWSGMVYAHTRPGSQSGTCPVIVCGPVYPMRKAYTLQQKAEAIALAAIVGSEAAAEQLGMDPRSVRKWASQAGRAPELSAKPDQWSRLHDLAMARVTSDLASGRMKPRDVAVVAAIARRNLSKPERPADARRPIDILGDLRQAAWDVWPSGEAATFWATFNAWMDESVPEDHWSIAGRLIIAPFSLEWHHLREHRFGQPYDPRDPELWAVVETPSPTTADDLLLWAIRRVESHGDLGEWEAATEAEEQRHREEMAEKGRQTALAYQQRALDAETQRLIEAAEAWLASQSVAVDAGTRLDQLMGEP
jgi:hypothetical protein